jgi:hypothetical protein
MMELDSTSRRAFVLAAGFAGFGLRAAVADAAAATPANATAAAPTRGYAADPLARDNRALVKLFTSLDGSPAPWWFAGYIYAIQLGKAPIPLVRCLGCEVYYPKLLPDGSVLARGATLTFFRDVATGAFLDQLQNPLTGKVNETRPNAMRSRGQSGMFYPADGSVPYVIFGAASDNGQLNYKPPVGERKNLRGELSIERVGDRVVVTTSHGVDTPAQPWLEVSSVSGDAAALADPALPSVKASGSATYASPWVKWLQMDDVPGHLMWAVASEKLASLDALPRVYREHAEQKKLMDTLSPPSD